MEDQAFYQIVLDELRTHGPIESLWGKAFSESGGNENQAKALYMRLRVQQLMQLAKETKAHQEELAEQLRQAELDASRKAYEAEQKSKPFWRRDNAPFLALALMTVLAIIAIYLYEHLAILK